MKLYFSPGACSFAPHVALIEAGLPFEAVPVDLRTHTLRDGTDYRVVNPKGYVPLLELDDGSRLTEVAVMLQYIADRKPGTLAPEFGTLERYRVMEWLNFIATEVHKGYGPLWYPDTPDATKAKARTMLAKRYAHLESALAAQPYLGGEAFGIADAYLYAVTAWARFLKVDLTGFPAVMAHFDRIGRRASVRAAQAAERPAKAA